jgi:hypothetical protein
LVRNIRQRSTRWESQQLRNRGQEESWVRFIPSRRKSLVILISLRERLPWRSKKKERRKGGKKERGKDV